jgi:hypothetical protein
MEMDETTKKNIYEILEQAKVLEELMKEVELPLSKQQVSNLKIEDYHINKALCWVDCIGNVISRIDSALHHPEEYLEPDPIPSYDGEAEAVYARLCAVRDDWKNLYYSDTADKRTRQFLIASRHFTKWTGEMFKYTEYLAEKYGLMPSLVRIGGMPMVDLGVYNDRNGSISYNRRLIRDPEYAIITVIHELCHIRYPNHSREFWQLYEDICISEGVLLERVLGERKSLRELKIEKIPYKWRPTVDYFTDNEKITIEKILKYTNNCSRSFME